MGAQTGIDHRLTGWIAEYVSNLRWGYIPSEVRDSIKRIDPD